MLQAKTVESGYPSKSKHHKSGLGMFKLVTTLMTAAILVMLVVILYGLTGPGLVPLASWRSKKMVRSSLMRRRISLSCDFVKLGQSEMNEHVSQSLRLAGPFYSQSGDAASLFGW